MACLDCGGSARLGTLPLSLPHRLKAGNQLVARLEAMSIESVFIRDEMIRLGQFLKLANLVENGVHAREVIRDGLVKVNGDICEQRGRQLHAGDRVTLNGVTVQVAHD